MEEVIEVPGEVEDKEEQVASKGLGRKILVRAVAGAVAVAAAVGGGAWWVEGQRHIGTDDAFVESHVHSVAARVPGTVEKVLVQDNQFVHKGDLLVVLDNRDYAVRVATAQADLDVTRNDTAGDLAQVAAAQAQLERAEAQLAQAQLDRKRAEALVQREVMPAEQLDRRRTDETVAAAQVQEAKEGVRRAQASVGLVGKGRPGAREAQRRSALEQEQLNLSYTRICAPADGYVTRKAVEPGNRVQSGQPLLAVVPLSQAWITANYKESQLTHVRPGQKVIFRVDAYPGREFTGKVESVMAGTGAAFSLLPPENATGNYVKVVQRVPVKIAIDRADQLQSALRVGMSVTPEIQVERSTGAIIRDLLHLS
ncbi:HlyD family secretion protein [Geomesophilobacter sediminis]|uniref:HlyD family secretion protein n=1 Tax=Geomesophilobacter sediminis TaxID=2798584 RepID=A0A8J7LW67_9BACT|nr:HlyD family secretion protein [Geomesophilobacter sediminis]MBJ6725470.1 HlyD family secretion protein [Geomesophilobacter sediminis]